MNPDDSWDVVVGEQRTLPDNSMKYPISGIRYYFDNDLRRPRVADTKFPERLHASTWDWSVLLRALGLTNNATTGEQGFDSSVRRTRFNWYVVSKNGMGDGFNMGGRSGNYNHFGLFWGTARVQGGTQEWQDNSVLDLNNDGKISGADADIISAALGQTAVGTFDARDVNEMA